MPIDKEEARRIMAAGEQQDEDDFPELEEDDRPSMFGTEDVPAPEGPPWDGAAVREDAIRGNAFIGNRLGSDPAQNIPDRIPVDDPWQHRAVGMKCHTCMWFAPKKRSDVGWSVLGRCRRRAPTMNGYPAVFESDWCGDHKLNEDKI